MLVLLKPDSACHFPFVPPLPPVPTAAAFSAAAADAAAVFAAHPCLFFPFSTSAHRGLFILSKATVLDISQQAFLLISSYSCDVLLSLYKSGLWCVLRMSGEIW